ncbi:NAD-dependent epimerase/dehydratase family protein, partial [Stutzerimonas stutzeri]|uniref:NAD-dependent epimerase/dehydratase family protein n=1 Tax=Stutzerimonas stutzeri TaxID=316 RepID=UPI001BD5A20B
HEVVGLDRSPFATTRIIADVTDRQAVARAVQGVDAVIHTAALHAPHVGLVPDAVFQQINVDATAHLLQAAREAGARRFVLTSTTALYGHAVVAGGCRWIDEDTEPLPRTIYHRTKLQAEALALMDQVLDGFIEAREREGGKLAAAIAERVDGIERIATELRTLIPAIRDGQRAKLAARLSDL